MSYEVPFIFFILLLLLLHIHTSHLTPTRPTRFTYALQRVVGPPSSSTVTKRAYDDLLASTKRKQLSGKSKFVRVSSDAFDNFTLTEETHVDISCVDAHGKDKTNACDGVEYIYRRQKRHCVCGFVKKSHPQVFASVVTSPLDGK